MTTVGHAIYGASSAERWVSCPGSIRMQGVVAPLSTSDAAEEGTLAHEVFAELLRSSNMNETIEELLSNPRYHTDMIFDGRDAVLWILEQQSTYSQIFVEHKVRSDSFTLPDQFGSLDAAVVDDDKFMVIDYKYGYAAVDPTYNHQLIYYAIALADELGVNPKNVNLVIIQPRLMDGSEKIKMFSCGGETLDFYRIKFRLAVTESLKPDPQLYAGRWCRYCSAAMNCPEFLGRTVETFEESALDSAIVPKFSNTITPGVEARFDEFLEAAELMEIFISQVKSRAFQILANGGSIRGYKLVERRATRKWKNEQEVIQVLSSQVPHEMLFSKKLNSPATLEKIAGKEIVNSLVEKKSSGLTVTKTEDKRSAVKGNNPFTVITDDDLAGYTA